MGENLDYFRGGGSEEITERMYHALKKSEERLVRKLACQEQDIQELDNLLVEAFKDMPKDKVGKLRKKLEKLRKHYDD